MDIKQFIIEKLGQQIKFEKHFDLTLKNLKNNEIELLKNFIMDCFDGNYRPAITKSQDIAFIKKIGNSKRSIIINLRVA